MAYFAELDENDIVLRVIAVNNNELLDNEGNEIEQKGIDFCVNLFGGRWLQTSYNTVANEHTKGKTPFRKNFAGVASIYHSVYDGFSLAKPFNSWILNENTLVWESPIPYPEDGKKYLWNEETEDWKEV
jgi:hypothetical protein